MIDRLKEAREQFDRAVAYMYSWDEDEKANSIEPALCAMGHIIDILEELLNDRH